MSISDLVWELKFRPKTVADTILPKNIKKMIQDQIKSGSVPNYLFSGSPGIGKTTLAYVIANELDADVLFINASLDGNIDLLRTKLIQFVSSVSFTSSKKLVILDEFEYITAQTQPAMRGFLDEFSSNALFILTCNYPERIITPLQSRLTRIDFKFTKEEVQVAQIQMFKRVCTILESENIVYDKQSVVALVKKNFPDFRRVLVDLQRYSSSGEIDSGILGVSGTQKFDELISAIKNKDFKTCRQWIVDNPTDPSQFYRMFYDKVTLLLVPQSIPQMILLIGESQFRAAHSIDLEINYACMIIQVMQMCQFK